MIVHIVTIHCSTYFTATAFTKFTKHTTITSFILHHLTNTRPHTHADNHAWSKGVEEVVIMGAALTVLREE